MKVETPVVKTNAGLVRALNNNELLKEAMDNSTYFIRDRVYETGFLRRLIEPISVTAADLDRVSGSSQPAIILEKDLRENDVEAYTIPFRGRAGGRFWETENPIVLFDKIETPRYSKSKFELMTSKTPYTQILEQRFVNAAQRTEDETAINAFNEMIDRAEFSAPGTQYQQTGGGLTKDNIALIIKMLSRLRMIPTERNAPKPKFLMSQTLKADLIRLGMIDVGDANVSKYWNEGTLVTDTLAGFPVVDTVKNDLVKDNELYLVAPQDYFGRFFILQDHTMVIKTEGDMVDMWTYGAFGMGFVNTKGVVKIEL